MVGAFGLLAFFFFGKHPYLDNYKTQGNIFFPIYDGSHSKELGNDYYPKQF